MSDRLLTDEQIHAIADDLRGTCDDIDSQLPDNVTFDDLTVDDCAALDNEVIQCAECGWWVDSDEINEDGNCDECSTSQ